MAVVCPDCGGDTTVKDSRDNEVAGRPTVKRRRACDRCGHRITTFEVHEGDLLALEQQALEAAKRKFLHFLADLT